MLPRALVAASLLEKSPNTADQLRSSIACAGFVSCIRLILMQAPLWGGLPLGGEYTRRDCSEEEE